MQSQRIEYLIDTARRVFDIEPYRNVTLPISQFKSPSDSPILEIPALWTKDSLRAHWNNLAVIAGDWDSRPDGEWWKTVANGLSIPLIITASSDAYCFITKEPSEDLTWINEDELARLLDQEQKRLDLFSPIELGKLRRGQLSFADLEERIEENSFSTQLRDHRTALDDALKRALDAALEAQMENYKTVYSGTRYGMTEERADILNPVINVGIAYLSARILDDKGFFGNRTNENDPRLLLERTIGQTNGFFKRTHYDDLPSVADEALQQLALHLGNSMSFTLVDHRDVGRLYEHAVQVFQDRKIDNKKLGQHYTPIAIAEKMLAHLPLEQLRPEERYIFDPAAGSGSLLLAATQRLALMPDVAMIKERKQYLADHVMGNDLDSRAHLIAELRYTLLKESLGQQDLFPVPSYFGQGKYEDETTWSLPNKPRVYVANPPFAEDGNIQLAAQFVEMMINRMQAGDQFAFVLPQTFLVGKTHGMAEARKEIMDQCHIYEVWQMPEGYIGLSARQPTCIVTAVVGKNSKSTSIARKIISSSQQQRARSQGYLGQSWLGRIGQDSTNWNQVISPIPIIDNATLPLKALYFICTGIGTLHEYPPLPHSSTDAPTKLFWKHKWRTPKTLWANPNNVPNNERYILFGKEFLEGHRTKMEIVYDSEKILVSRITNQNSAEPLGASFDSVGLCPTKNVFCIVPNSLMQESTPSLQVPIGWNILDFRQKLYWLLGILSSDLAIDVVLPSRTAGYITEKALQDFPLPLKIDFGIIKLVEEIIKDEMKDASDIDISSKSNSQLITDRREKLNRLVETSYGNPKRPTKSLTRVGAIPDLEEQRSEREKATITITGQVLDIDQSSNQVKLYISGLDDEVSEEWVALPQELPAWALDGTIFEADLSKDVESFAELSKRPWSLRRFKHTPRPYLSLEELQNRLLLQMKD